MRKSRLRNQTVSLAKYREVLRYARQIAAQYGIDLRIYRRPIVWNGYGGGMPRRGVHGTYYSTETKAVVTALGKTGRAQILFTVFHELRHGIHHKTGQFARYYEIRPDTDCGTISTNDVWIGLQAEQDCNDWAREQLLQLDIWSRPDMYPLSNVMTYRMYPDQVKFWPKHLTVQFTL